MSPDLPRKRREWRNILSGGILILSLAAFQSPLWRPQGAAGRVSVRDGGATLIAVSDSVAQVSVEGSPASAEIVGKREILVRGIRAGSAKLTVSTGGGGKATYSVVVEPADAEMSSTNSSR